MTSQSRQSSMQLSPIKVRSYLAGRNIFSLRAFEIAYAQAQGRNYEGTENTTPKNAWQGKPIANNRAQDIASFLGLSSPLALLPDSHSPWELLVYNQKFQGHWLSFHAKETELLNLIVFDCDNPYEHEQLNQHKITTRFHLELQAERGDHFLLIMRSVSQFVVLAPVEHAYHQNFCTAKGLIYPQNGRSFAFDLKQGGGFRELIGVRIAGELPFHARSAKTGYITHLDELNRFALQIQTDKALSSKVSVVIYPFFLLI